MPLWNYAFNQGGPDPDYVYLTAELDPAGHVPDLGVPGDVALRRDHAADVGHAASGAPREREVRSATTISTTT